MDRLFTASLGRNLIIIYNGMIILGVMQETS